MFNDKEKKERSMKFIAVFLGGGLGALVRYIFYLILPKFSYLPLGTLLANFLGCFFATVVFMYLVAKCDIDSVYKSFLITGFCGGLSTLSALSLELLKFIQTGDYIRAFIYTITTVFVCTASVLLGIILVKYLLKL